MSVDEVQHGGNHYKIDDDRFQHWNFVVACDLGYHLGNATKYITRHRKKNGVEDLKKAGHYIDKMVELIRSSKVDQPISGIGENVLEEYCHANQLELEGPEHVLLDMLIRRVTITSLVHASNYLKLLIAYCEQQKELVKSELVKEMTEIPKNKI